MGGKILDLDAIKIFDEGIEKGVEKGVEKTQADNFIEMIKDGVSIGKAKQYSGISDENAEKMRKLYNL